MRVTATALILVLVPASACSSGPIREERFVQIGGIPQWITIKGDDRKNPAVLFLHGGPGNAFSPYADAMFEGWERDLTLVQWDQRGAGRTYGKSGPGIEPTMTMERMVADGIEVAEYVVKRLGNKKILLVGGSWGSILGIEMVHARPELFQAYVGMGQLVAWQDNVRASYDRVLELARESGDGAAVAALESVGPPPWDAPSAWREYRKYLQRFQSERATAPAANMRIAHAYASEEEQAQYAAADDFSFIHFVGMNLSGSLTRVDLRRLDSRLEVPIFFVQGEEDLIALPELARGYLESLRAPAKRFHLVPGTAHEPSAASLRVVHDILVAQVAPS